MNWILIKKEVCSAAEKERVLIFRPKMVFKLVNLIEFNPECDVKTS